MNPFIEDYLVAEHHRNLSEELTEIQLQSQALNRNQAHHTSLFTNTMCGFGQWLIVRGEKLVKRYEAPANSQHPSEHRFAH